MTSNQLKIKLNEEHITQILESTGCHSIKQSKNYIQAGLPNGDNPKSVCVYIDNTDYFTSIYTRPEFEKKHFKDIITLVEFIEHKSNAQAIYRICKICGFDYYKEEIKMPSFLKWLSFVETGIKKITDNEDVKVFPEKILNQFDITPVLKWVQEGISSKSQRQFQIGLDVATERIVIPIRDELGALVGVKGRLLSNDSIENDKYMYLYSCPKNKILFGLDQNFKEIIKANEVIVVEAEKSVIKLNSLNYKNAVAIGSKSISRIQTDKLLRLNVPITLALDKDVVKEELTEIVNDLKFPFNLTHVSIIFDLMGFLEEKESPMDNAETWDVLYQNYKFKM